MSDQEMLVRVYVGDESVDLGMSFEDALALAIARADAAANLLEIQARDLGLTPRKVE